MERAEWLKQMRSKAEALYPPLKKVREWIDQAGLAIEEEGAGSGFHHFVARKR
jgi:hypothetical protein